MLTGQPLHPCILPLREYLLVTPTVVQTNKRGVPNTPPLPRYRGTWDINTVLCYISGHCLDHSLTLMLLRSSQSADFVKCSIKGYRTHLKGQYSFPQPWQNSPDLAEILMTFSFPSLRGMSAYAWSDH